MMLVLLVVSVFRLLYSSPFLNSPISDKIVYVNESFEFKIPVDHFLSSKFHPVYYTVNSTNHQWLTQESINPTFASKLLDTDGDAKYLHLDGDLLYATDSKSVLMFNVSNPFYFRVTSSLEDLEAGGVVYGSGTNVYASVGAAGLRKYILSDLKNPKIDGNIDLTGLKSIKGKGNILYVLSEKIFHCIDITSMQSLGNLFLGNNGVEGISLDGSLAFVADEGNNVYSINISVPTKPIIKESLNLETAFSFLKFDDMNTHYLRKHKELLYLVVSNDDRNDGFKKKNYTLLAINITSGLALWKLTNSFTNSLKSRPIHCLEVVSHRYAFICSQTTSSSWDATRVVKIVELSTVPATYVGVVDLSSTGVLSIQVKEDETTLFVADRDYGIRSFNISRKIGNGTMMGWYEFELNTMSDKFREVEVSKKSSYVFLTYSKVNGDLRWSGVRCLDLSDPYVPQMLGFYEINDLGESRFHVSELDKRLYLCTEDNGVFVLDYEEEYDLKLLNVIPPMMMNISDEIQNFYCRDISLVGDLAYVLFWGTYSFDNTYLRIINISNIFDPVVVSTTHIDSYPAKQSIEIRGNFAFIAGGNVYVVDISNLSSPVISREISAVDKGNYVDVVVNSSMIVACDDVVELRDLYSYDLLSSISVVSGHASKVVVSGRTGFIANEHTGGGLTILDLRNLTNPTRIYEDGAGNSRGIATLGNLVFMADNERAEFSVLILGESKITGTPTVCGDYRVTVSADDLDYESVDGSVSNSSFMIGVRKLGYVDCYCSLWRPRASTKETGPGLFCATNC